MASQNLQVQEQIAQLKAEISLLHASLKERAMIEKTLKSHIDGLDAELERLSLNNTSSAP
jgi:septal ring factor EnvC (AmiA/AmiB activator)